MVPEGSSDQRKPRLRFRPNSQGGQHWDPQPPGEERETPTQGGEHSTQDSHGHRQEERSHEGADEGSALDRTQTAESELTYGPKEEWEGEVGNFRDSTHTAGKGTATLPQGTTMDGFEPIRGEFEEGEESDQEGDMEEPRSEWDEGDSTEGAQLSVSSPTNSEVCIHERDWVEM